jgi:hypothetical protein
MNRNAEQKSEVSNPMIEMDAHEFGLHLRQGGWRLGLLVARSVEPGVGDRSVSSGERRASIEGKVSASHFGRLAFGHENGEKRVLRYYRAWERAAARDKVPHAVELAPGDDPEITWEKLPPWRKYFNPAAWDDGGATGPLNLTIKFGKYGDKLLRSHKSLVHFIERELPKQKLGKNVRALAGNYAAAHEAEARILRRVEAGEAPTSDEVKAELAPTKFFKTAR